MCVCVCVCVCVRVFFPFILDVRFVGCISRESQRRKVTHDLFSSHLPSAVHAFIFSREGFSRSFPSSAVMSNFVY